jgi:hypothetical protein
MPASLASVSVVSREKRWTIVVLLQSAGADKRRLRALSAPALVPCRPASRSGGFPWFRLKPWEACWQTRRRVVPIPQGVGWTTGPGRSKGRVDPSTGSILIKERV